jgi:general secretion pathway protein D
MATVLTSVIQGNAKTDAKSGAAPGTVATPLADGETRVTGEVRVTADPTSNSLVVLASGRDYFAIKEIIKQLDEPRRQVYIEGMIVEVSLSNDLDLGVTAHGLIPGSSMLLGSLNTGGTNGASSLSPETTIPTSSGIVTGVLSSATTTIMGTTIPSYGALLTAVATKTNSNVMSLPSIIAVDNQLTHLSIGTNIAYQKGTTYVGVGGSTPQQNYERENLDLKLDIKPHISPDETVLLEIDHSAKDLGETTALGPTWNTRELKGQVVVRDQQTVVIGGLISTKEYVTKTQIPILGDIPVLGALFRSTKKQKRKANMVILLTPYIVRDQADIEAIRSRRMKQTEEFVRSFATLDGMKYQPRIDYQRKRGLVEEINRAVQTVEEDAAALNALRAGETMKQGAI